MGAGLRRLGLLPLLGLVACLGSATTTSLRLQGGPKDASVTVDDQRLGDLAFVGARGVALPPGKHRLTVERVGYFPRDVLVAVDGEERIVLDVTLEKLPE